MTSSACGRPPPADASITNAPGGSSAPADASDDMPPPPRLDLDEKNSWAFAPAADPLRDDARLDLRSLNEPVAGQSGFIQRSVDGMSFVDGKGKPMRFWSAVDGGWGSEVKYDRGRHLRFLAKYGINMVRIHAAIYDQSEGAKITAVNEPMLDGIFRYVAEAKKHGMYVTLSPYWSIPVKPPKSWGLEGYTGKAPAGLLFFDPKLQAAYKAWVKELYTRVNPHTGLALKDEPAIALIQIQNEDSLLFYTSQDISEPHAGRLRKRFGAWLAKKYGSLAAARRALEGATHPEDNAAKQEVGLYPIWDMTSGAPVPPAPKAQRLADQLAFMTELQRTFHEEMQVYYRETLGCRQLINAGNWKSADPVLLEDAERYSYTPNEVSAVNRYTGGIHIGDKNGWRIDSGHLLRSDSVLKHPETFPAALKQTVGQPMVITESSWTFPARYQSEGTFLAAAYMSLTGVDSLYWFAHGDEEQWSGLVWPWWKSDDGKNSLRKWDSTVPMQLGMMPAPAIAFRLGYIKAAAEPVVYEERSLDAMWQRRVPIIAEEGKFDPNRDTGAFAPASPVKQEVDRLAFFAGPVHVKFGGNESNSHVADLSKLIDSASGRVTSVTGEIELDTKQGLCTVVTEKFQGLSGFLYDAGRRFEVGDLVIRSANEYATVAVVALDDQPIKRSRKLLIQIGTVARPTGWKTAPTTHEDNGQKIEALTIVDPGGAPLRIADTAVSLSIKNPELSRAVQLDPTGYAQGPIDVTQNAGGIALLLPRDAMYVIVE